MVPAGSDRHKSGSRYKMVEGYCGLRGDGFGCCVDPTDPDLVYFTSQGGAMARRNFRTGETAPIRPRPPEPGKPLQSQRWGGAIDTVGGATLANVSAQLRYGATVTVCGNAGSAEVPLSVYPLILRAVSLVGINSVETPRADRIDAWQRLGRDIDLSLLDSLTSTISLADAPAAAARMLAGVSRGRVVVDVRL